VFPLFFFFFFFRYEFIRIVFSEAYLPSVPLFAISVMTLLLRCYNFTSILQHLNRVKIINWGALLDLSIALSLSYPLFLWKGLSGVAFAFMMSTYIQATFYLIRTAQVLRCSVLDLIPWRQWSVMLIVFGSLAIGLHEVLARFCSVRQSLLLGLLATAAIIGAALVPVIFKRKTHG
jgi:O-antigen/teichoic acid export membrane protein